MARDILMPQMGYDMTQGTMVRWLKKVGDRVHKGDVVAEIETDKATVEIEAFDSGVLLRVIAQAGDTVPVGQPIATLGEKGEELGDAPAAPAQPAATAPATAAPGKAPGPPKSDAPPVAAPKQADSAPVKAPASPERRPAAPASSPAPALPPARGDGPRSSPLARRLAAELGVDLTRVTGTGPGGRIGREDVEAAASQAPASAPARGSVQTDQQGPSRPPLPPGAEDIEPTRLRQAIARRMAESKRNAPHFYVSVQIQADGMLAMREKLNRGKKTKISVNDFLVKGLALAALEHPNVNSAYLDGVVRRFATVDIGIAIATDNGLLSPAIADCGSLSLADISTRSRDLAERARTGHLRPEEYGGGTLTLSNLGMYGVDEFLAIINPPQALIVSVGAAGDRVIAAGGKPTVARVMTAWAAADHRVLDGADVAKFMATLRTLIEDPARLAE